MIHLVHRLKIMTFYIKYCSAKTNFSAVEFWDSGPGDLWSTHHSEYNDVRHDICYNIPYSRQCLHCGGNRFPIQLYDRTADSLQDRAMHFWDFCSKKIFPDICVHVPKTSKTVSKMKNKNKSSKFFKVQKFFYIKMKNKSSIKVQNK